VAPNEQADGFGAFGRRPRTRNHCPPTSAIGRTEFIPPDFYGPRRRSARGDTLAARTGSRARYSVLRARRASLHNSETRGIRVAWLSSSLALGFYRRGIVACSAAASQPCCGDAPRQLVGVRPACCRFMLTMRRRPVPTRRLISPSRNHAKPSGLCADRQCRRRFDRKAGMAGLTLFLAPTYGAGAGDPVGVIRGATNWSLSDGTTWFLPFFARRAGAPKPPQDAQNRIDAYMKQAARLMFDTRDAGEHRPETNGAYQTRGMLARSKHPRLARRFPKLEPVPRRTRTDQDVLSVARFPGRLTQARPGRDLAARGRRGYGLPSRRGGGRSLANYHHVQTIGPAAWAIRYGTASRAALTPAKPRPARIRLSGRRQHRDVYADRETTGGPGACAAMIERLGQ